jgi:uncharacterized damage-inducible protein DinB
MITKPDYSDLPTNYFYYFNLITETNLMDALKNSHEMTLKLISSIPSEKEDYKYAENKWTLKQVLSHIVDCERIYTYRALRFSRLDNTELAGFDENIYAVNSNASERNLHQFLEEYDNIRKSTINLYSYMTDEMLDFKGIANKVQFTARLIGFIAAGHNVHHCNLITERYL